jgi:hypothetical protein
MLLRCRSRREWKGVSATALFQRKAQGAAPTTMRKTWLSNPQRSCRGNLLRQVYSLIRTFKGIGRTCPYFACLAEVALWSSQEACFL